MKKMREALLQSPVQILKMDTKKVKTVRLMLYTFLEKRNSSFSYWYHHAIAFLIILSLAIAAATSVFQKKGHLKTIQLVLELILLAIFTLEFSLRVWGSGATGTYGGKGGLKKYLQKPHMMIDVTVIASSLLLVILFESNISKQLERISHLFQILRIVRLDRHRGAFSAFIKVFKRHRNELITCWYMGFLVVLLLSFLVFAFETKHDEASDNLFNSFYWGVISLTTIGYGDINPERPAGKILICFFALYGALFLALPAGIIGSGFALQVSEQQKEKHVNRRRRPAAELLQSYWRKYAADHDIESTWRPHIQGRERNFEEIKKRIEENSSFTHRKKIFDDQVENIYALWYPRKTLTVSEKNALRFVRHLKWVSASRKFRQARRPYDERDVLASFTSTQVEIFAKLKEINNGIQSRAREIEMQFKTVSSLSKEVKRTNQMLKELLSGDAQEFSDNISSQQKSADLMDDESKINYKSSLGGGFYFTRSNYQGNSYKKDTKINSAANLFSSEENDDYSTIKKDADDSKNLPEIYEKCLKTMFKNFQLEAKKVSYNSDEEDIE